MSDQETNDQATETMTVSHSTGEKVIPKDKVLELASRGLDLEVRERGLSDREAAVAGQEKALPEYGRLKERLQTDPNGMNALDLTIKDPSFVVKAVEDARRREAAGDDGGDLDDLTQRQVAANPDVDALRREIGELKSSISEIGNKGRAEDARAAATTMLAQYPWLSGPAGQLNEAGDMAMDAMISELNQNSSLSAEAAAASAATRVRKVLVAADSKALTRQTERDPLDLADPAKAVANLAQDKPFTKADLGTGRIHAAALRVAEAMGINKG